jgi:hypothetical protein
MDDEVAVVDENPASLFRSLKTKLMFAALLHLGIDLACDCMTEAPRARGGDDEEVKQWRCLTQIEQQDVLGSVVVCDPGSDPCVFERLVDPFQDASIDSMRGNVVLS